jgi:hypothetical protein
LNVDLSAVPEADSSAGEDVSNQLTISNIDEQTNGSSQSNLEESGSANVVSNKEDTTIDAKDSANNNIIKASNEGNDVLADSNFVILNTPSKSVVNVGDVVDFKVYVKNYGDGYDNYEKYVGVNFYFDTNGFDYVGYTPCLNPDNHWDLHEDFREPIVDRKNEGFTQYGYNFGKYGTFQTNFCFEFIVTLKAINTGTFYTTASITQFDSSKRAQAQTYGVDLEITNTPLNPISGPGDYVNFEVSVKNNGGTYEGEDIGWVKFIGIDFFYDNNNLVFKGSSYDNPLNYLDLRLNPDNRWNLVQFAYNTSNNPFKNGDTFKFNVTFQVKNSYGTFETTSFITQFYSVSSKNATTSMRPNFEIINTALNSISGVGDKVAFEIFVKNNGGTFHPNYILETFCRCKFI